MILSLGGNNEYDFERSMVAHGSLDTPIHTFDCTVKRPRVPVALHSRVTFHPICVGAFDGYDAAGRRFMRWRTLLASLGSPHVELLKVDIEGHERAMLWEMLTAPSGGALPAQLSVELHANTQDEAGFYTHTGRRLATLGELALLATLWHTRGYVLISREDNWLAYRANRGLADCTELTLLRVRCASATDPIGSPLAPFGAYPVAPTLTAPLPRAAAALSPNAAATSATAAHARADVTEPVATARPAAVAASAVASEQDTPTGDALVVDGAGTAEADGVYARVADVGGRPAYRSPRGCLVLFHTERTVTLTSLHGWGLVCLGSHLYATHDCTRSHPTLCSWYVVRRHHGDPTAPVIRNASAPANATDQMLFWKKWHGLWRVAASDVPPELARQLPIGEPLIRPCRLDTMGRRVAAFSYVKDEVDIVATWVHYHAALFGYDKIHVIVRSRSRPSKPLCDNPSPLLWPCPPPWRRCVLDSQLAAHTGQWLDRRHASGVARARPRPRRAAVGVGRLPPKGRADDAVDAAECERVRLRDAHRH